MPDRLAVLPQYLLPKQALTVLAGRIARARGGALTHQLIRGFVRRYQVNMAEAANPDPASYATFNDFFTRALKPDARPLARAELVCPVDGAISQFGAIEQDRIFRPRVTTTPAPRYWVVTRHWRPSLMTGCLPPYTSARVTTTVSTCPAMGA